MGTFDSFALFTGLIGGLALFLYGMNVMSGALTKAAGGRLESVISRVTSNRFVAYLFGVAITALVQSSSASTVMIVGLVNAGLMTLAEAVNLILGANLGTTFTAWLLSLNAISSEFFLINLLKPTSFTPFLAIIGVALYMFSKADKKKNIGQIMIGFSVLMFGMNMMSGAVSPLKDVPAFTSALTYFSNPVLGFAVGALFTMVIQSSAGTIGVVQALSLSVAITYGMAIPLVVGAEVGTCITAVLSSFGAGRNAKRTAAMHLSFNVIKALTFLIVFYALNAALHFAFLSSQIGMVGVALIHTLVNLVATLVALPFSQGLVALAYRLLPVTEAEKAEEAPAHRIQTLDERFLANPPFAVQQSRLAAIDMAQMARDAFLRAVSLSTEYTQEKAEEVKRLEKQIDSYEDQLGTYLVRLNSHHLAPADSHSVSILLHCINDFERISDHALNIMEIFEEMHEKKRAFTDKAQAEIHVMIDAVTEAVRMAEQVFETGDRQTAHKIEPLEEVVDKLHAEIKERHLRRMRKGKFSIDMGFDLSDLGMNLERVADHCSNVAVCVLQVEKDGFDTHEYLEMVRSKRDAAFAKQARAYREQYALPQKKQDAQEKDKSVRDGEETPKQKKKDKKKKKEKEKIKKSKRSDPMNDAQENPEQEQG